MISCTELPCTTTPNGSPLTSVESEMEVWPDISSLRCDIGGFRPSVSGVVHNINNNNNALRVGCAFMTKKMESMKRIIKLETKNTYCATGKSAAAPMHGGKTCLEDISVVFQTIQLEDGVPLEVQGEFDVILHKLSEDVYNRYVFLDVYLYCNAPIFRGGWSAVLLHTANVPSPS